jgi:ADP-ribose pyrophosphatase YjhB (NUDIX family)
MKFYTTEGDGSRVDLSKLEGSRMSVEGYAEAQANLIIACHDVYIEIADPDRGKGILLVRRKQEPAKGSLWPVGGRMLKGISPEDSLRRKVKEECGLELEKIEEIGNTVRAAFNISSFDHGKGYDAIVVNYFARGLGKIKLNELHGDPTIITPLEYTAKFRERLHPYVRDFMDLAMERVSKSGG